jgi:CheY-like chemotaxis protein
MPDSDGPRGPLEALRNAARGGQERFLVALSDRLERSRIAGALTSEGFVLEAESLSDALARLTDESFDLAILDLPSERLDVGSNGGRDPLAASRELRPFSDLILISDADPTRNGQAFAREVAAVLPRPLPEVDALLRAHIKRLAGFRRARTRGLLVLNAFAGVKDELAAADPALAATLEALVRESRRDPAIVVLGDAELTAAAGGRADEPNPDAAVVEVSASAAIDARLGEARARVPGAALIVVDAAPSTERLAAAIYGGARAYLPRRRAATARRPVCGSWRRWGAMASSPAPSGRATRRRPATSTRDSSPTPPRPARTRPSSPPATRCWWSTTRRSC